MASDLSLEDREFDFTDADFERIRKLMREWVGISFNDSKRSLVYNRLSKRLRQHHLSSFSDYLDYMLTNEGERELFINALTTNLTSFFREEHHFPALAAHLKNLARNQTIQIWCAAASTGEEPYSIAMTAIEALGNQAGKRVRILASDLDTHVLAHGAAGIYRDEQVKNLSQERLERFFLKGKGARSGFVKVKPELQAMISFKQINLLEKPWPVSAPLDVIFCRNVMIYFDKKMQLSVLERFAPLMNPQALLFIGHSESLHHASHIFHLIGKTTYRCVEGKAYRD